MQEKSIKPQKILNRKNSWFSPFLNALFNQNIGKYH